MSARIRVAIADDHALFRQGMAAMLGTVADIEWAGEAADGPGAVRLAVTDQPDVLLMDVRMPGLTGIEAAERVRRAAPGVTVVMLSMLDADEFLREALRVGAAGYVLKDAEPEELLDAIRTAAHGGIVFGASTADRLRDLFATTIGPWQAPLPHLSDRERRVLDLFAAGFDAEAIASRLHLSPKTVRNHLTTIPRRLGVPDRGAAIVVAREAGLGRASGDAGAITGSA